MALSRKRKRGALIVGGLGILGVAAGLVLYALSDTITFFYTPSDVVEKNVEPGTRMRLGGLVAGGLAGKLVDFGFSDKFLKNLEEYLQPGSSALILLVEDEWAVKASSALKDLGGVVVQQTLTDRLVENLTKEVDSEG